MSTKAFLSGIDDPAAVQAELAECRKKAPHNSEILLNNGQGGENVATPIFSKETASRLDKVRNYGRGKPIPGKRPSQSVLEDLGLRNSKNWPRYEPAYRVIQEEFPAFEWELHDRDGRRFVTYAGDPNPHVSLAEKVLEAYRRRMEGEESFSQRIALNSFPVKVQKRVKPLLRDEAGKEFAQLLVDIGISYPPLMIMEEIGNWLYRALNGEPSTIITPVCPDYETVPTGDPARPRAYTFRGLGSQVGYVAQRALRVLPRMWEYFRIRADIRFVVAIGDFEAKSAETCRRVGVTYEEFLSRLRQSQHVFAQCCNGMPLETPLLTEINPLLWEESMQEAAAAVAQGDYGALDLTGEDIETIAAARSSLYQRWFGDHVDCREILLRQAPEYMSMGRLADEFPNAMILGADAPAMAPFLQGLSGRIRPVLYLRSANY